jgi:general secretion pathway protein M
MIGALQKYRGTLISRIIALALPLLILCVAWITIISPIQTAFRNLDEEIAQRRVLLGRYVAVANQETAMRQSLGIMEAELDKGELLADAPPAILAAELQSQIAAVAQSNGLQILSTKVLQGRPSGLLRQAGIGISLQGTQENLRQALLAIESMRPYLFVERLVVNAQDQGTLNPQSPPMIFVEADIYGVIRPSPKELADVK